MFRDAAREITFTPDFDRRDRANRAVCVPGPLASCVYRDQLEAGSQILTDESPGKNLTALSSQVSSQVLREEHEVKSDTGPDSVAT